MSRPRPVLIFGAVIAGLSVLSESADALDVLPGAVLPWVRLALAVATAVGGALYVQTRVTPVSDPRTADGTPLIPVRDRTIQARRFH